MLLRHISAGCASSKDISLFVLESLDNAALMNGIRLEALEWPIHSQPYGMQPRLTQGVETVVRICGPWLPSIYLDRGLRLKYLKNVEINYWMGSRCKE